MSRTEERIRVHLESATSSLPSSGNLERVIREGDRRRMSAGLAAALATAAAVALVVTVAVALTPDEPSSPVMTQPIIATTTSPAPTTPRGPCTPSTSPLTDAQSLPPRVDATRQAIHLAAASCDYEALADLALGSGTSLSVGGEVPDPVAFWHREAESALEPLRIIAQLLSTTPHHDPATGIWVWPAVQGDPSDEASWAELVPILGRADVDRLRQDDTAYTGWRVGIDSEGRWLFAVAGD